VKESDRSRRVPLLVAACIAIVVFLAFLPVLHDGFVSWDDDKNFTENPQYRGLGPAQLRWMWTTFHMGHYVPLSWMTLGVDYRIWGMNPAGYHLTNLLLHTASGVVVYYLARRLLARALGSDQNSANTLNGVRLDLDMSKSSLTPFPGWLELAAAFAALAFAVHPLRVESVAWVTERRDVLSGFFYFSSLLAYVRSRDEGRGGRWYALALVLFVAALLSKATAMTLPAVLLILEVYPLRRIGGAAGWWNATARRVYRELAPFAALSTAAAALSIVALHPPSQLGFAAKVAVSAYSLMFYVWKTVAPTGLSPLYEMPQHVAPAGMQYVVGYAFTIGLAVLAWRVRARWPGVTAALLAFVVVTLPMLGIVQNGPQIAADRYTYYAGPALAILSAGALATAMRGSSRGLALALASAIVLALSALTWTQAGVWHDSRTLWTRVLAVDSASSIAHSAMANVLYKEGRVQEGVEHSEQAIAIAPGYAEAHNGLGVGLQRQGDVAHAIEEYQKALSIKPRYDDAENDLGIALAQQGDPASAIEHYARALEINPNNSNAQVNWGNALVRLNRPEEAIEHYAAALRLQPNNAEAHHNWGVALAREGKYAEAIEQFRRTLVLDSTHVEARDYLERASELLRRQGGAPRQ
jgi:tetratricopeptide (TPR) repeat protein